MATVTFHGACGVVTGSSTLLSWGETRILVDCGMYQGGEELEARNWRPFPFDPRSLTAVVLTHAHLDHTGLLPKLVGEGYRGPIYCSRASRGLVGLILEDAGEIQEEQARWARKKGYSRHRDPRPLYTSADAKAALGQLQTLSFEGEHELAPGVRLRLLRAGHLLGAAHLEVRAKAGDGERRTWLFSGDVGRYGVPILKDPQAPDEAPDTLLLESTYGDREHREEESRHRLGAIVDETFARGGKVLIPAFALGRTQEVLYHLDRLAAEGRLDPRDVFLDSPMAIDATELYARAKAEHDEELAALVAANEHPFDGGSFVRTRSVADSKALNERRRPAVIVASSGMATAGRIVHHLLRWLSDERTAVVFTGYQASGTRGRALLDGADTVGIHGHTVRVRASVQSLHGLSAHADRGELLRWCQALPRAPRRVFLNHGEDPPRKALAAALEEMGWPRPELPASGDSVPW
jgi:metallo-beta-lactamase family protein